MAQQLFFSRDTKVYIKHGETVWDLPVLDGFSFSQATNSSEITLAEMEGTGGVSRRGRKQFNDSLAPAEWSFSTYVRPFKSSGTGDGAADGSALTHAIEEVLWSLFLGGKSYSPTYDVFQEATPVTVAASAAVVGTSYVIVGLGTTTQAQMNTLAGTSSLTYSAGDSILAAAGGAGNGTLEQVLNIPKTTQSRFNADLSNSATLGTADIFFVLGGSNRKVYKLKDAIVNEASLDFDIDGIATINWSGMSSEIIDMTGRTITQAAIPTDTSVTADTTTVSAPDEATGHSGGDVWLDSNDSHRLHTILTTPSSANCTVTGQIYESTDSTSNFIRNRLTQLSVVPTTTNPTGDGSAELESSYSIVLTGGNITMTNNVTFITPEEIGLVNIPIGHVTGTRSVSGSMTCYLSKDTAATNNSADLWEDLKGITSVVTNSFNLTFKIGGATSNTTRLEVNMPTCHLEIPTHSIEDVISVETAFNALPSTIDGTNEATITYFSKQ